MSDANGGVIVLAIIVFFIVLVSAYLAFNVNYTKAFRMKNKIISYYDEYNGDCKTECFNKIKEYAKSIGYAPDSAMKCSSTPADGTSGADWRRRGNYYCEGTVYQRKAGVDSNSKEYSRARYYFKIETKIDIKIPIVDNILGIKVFRITGDTKVYEN